MTDFQTPPNSNVVETDTTINQNQEIVETNPVIEQSFQAEKKPFPKTILILLLLVILLGLAYFLIQSWQTNQKSSISEEANIIVNNDYSNQESIVDEGLDDIDQAESSSDSCEIFWTDPVLEEIGTIQALFLKEASSVQGTGYEAIVRRTVADDGYIDVDIVTNCLPEDLSPYYLFALAVDENGFVCSQGNLGPLDHSESPCFWGTSGLSLPVENVNDSQVFAITKSGFGENDSDQIGHISHPSIILLGDYASDYVKLD